MDGDIVDETNVSGGQMFRRQDVDKFKVEAVSQICREFGCLEDIDSIPEMYTDELGTMDVCITGLDNMAARKQVFNQWLAGCSEKSVFIDGRLTMEMSEILCVQGNNPKQIKEYREKYLFSDEEANLENCTTKQSTFGAMNISSLITATLCNWLTNNKLGIDMRETPFYQRTYLPLFKQDVI